MTETLPIRYKSQNNGHNGKAHGRNQRSLNGKILSAAHNGDISFLFLNGKRLEIPWSYMHTHLDSNIKYVIEFMSREIWILLSNIRSFYFQFWKGVKYGFWSRQDKGQYKNEWRCLHHMSKTRVFLTNLKCMLIMLLITYRHKMISKHQKYSYI